ncbi:MAG: hypothetical protein ACPG31_04995 [Planctomycetota bacterium]
MSDSEFSSFDEALKKLELEEEDLKRLISAGEIRAFREGSNMRLRVEDVSKVADQLGIGGSVAEADAGEVLEVEDLVLDEADDEGMATTQLSEEDTLLDDAVEELEVAEEAPAAKAGGRQRAAGGARSGRAAAAAAPTSDEGGGMRAAIILTSLLMLWGIAFAINMVSGQSSGVTAPIVDMVSE